MSENWKPKFIQLPLDKMAGSPWNLLDHRGFRIAWCGTDGNHEKDGELIANDLLNLIAIGEAVGELHERATAKQVALQAKLDAALADAERLAEALVVPLQWVREDVKASEGQAETALAIQRQIESALALHDALKKEQGL